jgi:tetratricopeptide (TPR) repeat protein
MPRTTLSIRVRDRSVTSGDGFRYALGDRFFYLYLLLAWQRCSAGAEDEYVACDVIRRLPHWERNTLDSVGKQIRRHVVAMQRGSRNVIEHVKAVSGPFRLTVPGRAIRFDVSRAEVGRLLDVPIAQGAGRREDADALFAFVRSITEGNALFDAGALDEARAAYERALMSGRTPEQRVTALQKLGRILERQARYDEARGFYAKCLALQRKHPELDQSTIARTYLFLGWLDYRRGSDDAAAARYGKALEIARGKRDDWLLGNIYNGLGLLEKRNSVFDEALARFRSALDYWCRADYPYGVAAIYANIGNTYLKWGNQLRDARLIAEAQSRYRRAAEWLTRALDFGAGAKLGKDSSEAEVALAEAYLGLGDLDRAWPLVCEARDAAEKTGNQLDLACALGVMAAVLWVRGDREQATTCGDDAARRFEQLGHVDRASELRERFRRKALLFPSAID